MAQCPKCGNSIKEDARLCPFCGSLVVSAQAPIDDQDTRDSQELGNELDPRKDSDSTTGQNPGNGQSTESGQGQGKNPESIAGQNPGGGQDLSKDPNPETDQKARSDQGSRPNQRPRGTFHISEEERRRNKRRNIIMVSIIGLLIVGILVTIFAISSVKPKVKLNDYIYLKTTGYDGIGHASLEFKYDEMYQEYIKSVPQFEAMFDECVKYEIDPEDNLKNGDYVSLQWKCDDEKAKKKYGCHLIYKDMEFKVSELEEAESFDPFEGIKVSFEGMNGHGHATYDASNNKNVHKMKLSFTFDQSEELSNGDVIKLSLNDFSEDDDVSDFIETYGLVPSSLSKEYTVNGLTNYVKSSQDLSDEAIRQMRKKAEDYYDSHLSEEFNSDGETFEGIDYIGYYLLTAKNGADITPFNKLYLVYKAHVLNAADIYRQKNVIYWYMSFENLSLTEEGEVEVDLDNCKAVDHTFSVYLESGLGSRTWYYHGYETHDDLYDDLVARQSDDYANESNVDDDGETSGEITTEAQEDETTESSDDETDETNENGRIDGEADGRTAYGSSANVAEDGIIFLDSSTRYLTEADVSPLTNEEIRAAINEIYARNGYIFKDKSIGDFYKKYDWYHPSVNYDQFDMDLFNDVEVANVVLLQKEREKRKP